MAYITFIDSSRPPAGLHGCEGLAFYAGGDTPYVWTEADVHQYPAKYLLPIWVRSDPGLANPVNDANAFVAVLLSRYKAPFGVLVALDSEVSVNPEYVKGFVTVLNNAGHPVIDYGSVSAVFGNDNPDGYYWGADWTDQRHLYPGTQMTQFANFGPFDESVALPSLPFWTTGHINPPPSQGEDNMISGFLTTTPDSIPFPGTPPKKIGLYQDALHNLPFPVAVRIAVHSRSKGYTQIEAVTIENNQPVEVTLKEGDVNAVSLALLTTNVNSFVGYTIA